MFDFPIKKGGLHRFIQNHAEALQNAALLLGGASQLRRVQEVLDSLSSSDRITRRIRNAIDDILGLLTLQHVADDNRPEAAYFAMLDPSQPYVEEICLLADGLQAALDSFDESARGRDRLRKQGVDVECRP